VFDIAPGLTTRRYSWRYCVDKVKIFYFLECFIPPVPRARMMIAVHKYVIRIEVIVYTTEAQVLHECKSSIETEPDVMYNVGD